MGRSRNCFIWKNLRRLKVRLLFCFFSCILKILGKKSRKKCHSEFAKTGKTFGKGLHWNTFFGIALSLGFRIPNKLESELISCLVGI